jgi:hypothetical protein
MVGDKMVGEGTTTKCGWRVSGLLFTPCLKLGKANNNQADVPI